MRTRSVVMMIKIVIMMIRMMMTTMMMMIMVSMVMILERCTKWTDAMIKRQVKFVSALLFIPPSVLT